MTWDSSTRRTRLPSDWKRRRLTALERDQYRCTAPEHDDRCDGTANEVHHLGADDDHRLHMLASLNHWCHQRETQAEAAAARTRHQRTRPAESHPGLS